MNKLAIATIVALMFLAAPAVANTALDSLREQLHRQYGTPRTQSTVVGVTVQGAPACLADDLTAESQALIQRWWLLNQKIAAKITIAPEEFQEGLKLISTGQCGLLDGGVPVIIRLLDGSDYLGVFPEGQTFIFKASGFIRLTK